MRVTSYELNIVIIMIYTMNHYDNYASSYENAISMLAVPAGLFILGLIISDKL